jgi:hypothetical protein
MEVKRQDAKIGANINTVLTVEGLAMRQSVARSSVNGDVRKPWRK